MRRSRMVASPLLNSAESHSRYTARAQGNLMKTVVLILLAAVVVSLFSGLFFLVKDKDSPDSTRMLTSLKIRVGLSIALIALLVTSYFAGWLTA